MGGEARIDVREEMALGLGLNGLVASHPWMAGAQRRACSSAGSSTLRVTGHLLAGNPCAQAFSPRGTKG